VRIINGERYHLSKKKIREERKEMKKIIALRPLRDTTSEAPKEKIREAA